MKTLFKIWFLQQRRQDGQRRIILIIYSLAMMLIAAFLVLLTMRTQLDEIIDELSPWTFVCLFPTAIALPELLMKIYMKHDATTMPDFLRARPMPKRTWNNFITLESIINEWTLMPPLMSILCCTWLLSWREGLAAGLLSLGVSAVSSLLTVCQNRLYTLAKKSIPVVIWFVWFFFFTVGAALSVWFGVGGVAICLLLCAVAIVTEYVFLQHSPTYAHHNQVVTNKQKTHFSGHKSHSSAYNQLQYECRLAWRCKRLRNSLLIDYIIFPMNVWLNAFDTSNGTAPDHWLLFALGAPCLTHGLMMLGAEGNYFDGLVTRPLSLQRLFRGKYYTICLLTLIAVVPIAPLMWLGRITLLRLLVMLIYLMGTMLLLAVWFSPRSPRIDLFERPKFYAADGGWNFMLTSALIWFAPVALYILLCNILPHPWELIATGIIGLVGIALHPLVCRMAEARWQKIRYERLEKYRRQ